MAPLGCQSISWINAYIKHQHSKYLLACKQWIMMYCIHFCLISSLACDIKQKVFSGFLYILQVYCKYPVLPGWRQLFHIRSCWGAGEMKYISFQLMYFFFGSKVWVHSWNWTISSLLIYLCCDMWPARLWQKKVNFYVKPHAERSSRHLRNPRSNHTVAVRQYLKYSPTRT